MKAANQWIAYRTRFLVQAKQLDTSLTFTDALGRQHSGSRGDYLVETSDGAFRIAPRQIFEDIYVPLLPGEASRPAETPPHLGTPHRQKAFCSNDTVPTLATLPPRKSKRQRDAQTILSHPPHLARKSPQPGRNSAAPSLRYL